MALMAGLILPGHPHQRFCRPRAAKPVDAFVQFTSSKLSENALHQGERKMA
jgi:hypothetical protein